MKNRLKFAGIGSVIALSVSSSLSAGDTLSSAVQKMLNYEPELRAASLDTVAAFHDQKMVGADLLPQVNISSSAGLYNRDRSIDGLEKSTGETLFSRQAGVNIRQLLFDFGEAGNRNQSAKNRLRMQEYLENAMVEARSIDMTEVYLEVLRLREQIRLAKGNIEEHQRVANGMRAKFENGGDRADVALVEGRLQLAKTDLEAQLLALDQAEGRYLRLTGELPDDLAKPAAPNLPGNREEIDLNDNWYILASKEAVDMAIKTRDADSKAGAPKVYAEGGYSAGDDVLGIEGQDNEARALVVLSWNIFEGGRNKHRTLRGNALEQKAKELMHGAEAEQNYQATLIWSEMQASKHTITALDSYATQLNQVSKDYDQQFEVGKRDILSILDVQNERHAADSRLLDAKYQTLASSFRLLGIQGYLVSSLVGDRPTVQVEKKKGIFGMKKSAEVSTPAPSPAPSTEIVPKVNTAFVKAASQATPVEISFGQSAPAESATPAETKKEENSKPSLKMLKKLSNMAPWRWSKNDKPKGGEIQPADPPAPAAQN